MTTTQTRPTPKANASGPTGGIVARRAVTRWSWRLFRREWRQQIMVLALITLSVTAMILGAGIATNAQTPTTATFGTADHFASVAAGDPHAASDIANLAATFGTVDVIRNAPLATGLAASAQLRSQDPNGAFGRPLLELMSGSYPTKASEVAMTERLAGELGTRVGDTWEYQGQALHVTGIVRNPTNLSEDFVLVSPTTPLSDAQTTVLFDATPEQFINYVPPSGVNVAPVTNGGPSPAFITFVVALFGLLFIGLVASAGFAVLAQRRLRGLGMLSSLGATDRNVRLVMVVDGFLVGVVGAVIGAVLGLALWILYAPHLSASANHVVTWTQLPWWLVVLGPCLAVITSTLAARRPARQVARTPVVAALQGRPPHPQPVHRSAIPALIMLVVGALLLWRSGGWGGQGGRAALFTLGGLLLSSVGLLLLAPLAVTLFGLRIGAAPVSMRIALRDIARYRNRSGAALAAISFAVFISMMVVLISTGRFNDPVDYVGTNMQSNQVILYGPGSNPNADGPVKPSATTTPLTQQRQTAAAIAAALGNAGTLELESTDASLAQKQGPDDFRGGPGNIYLATPAVLQHYGIDASRVSSDSMLITSRVGLEGSPNLVLLTGADTGPVREIARYSMPTVQTIAGLPIDTDLPNLLITESGASTLGVTSTPGAWLIQANHTVTPEQINEARRLARAAGMTIGTKSDQPSLSSLRDLATTAGILLALGILAGTVGLIRAEAANDLVILSANGARRRTRRSITAVTAASIALVSAVLGIAVAYLDALAYFSTQLSERMRNVPVLPLLVLVIGLPLIGAIGGWVFAAREPQQYRVGAID